jgi:hypothetical protein
MVTIRRHGSNYLARLLLQHGETFRMNRSHHMPTEPMNIVTLTRDPKDALLSMIAMSAHEGQEGEVLLQFYIDDYISLGLELYEKAKYVFDYNDLIKYPHKIAAFLSEVRGLKYIEEPYEQVLEDRPEVGYLVSSKTSPHYERLRPIVDNLDLSECYRVHELLLSRKVII